MLRAIMPCQQSRCQDLGLYAYADLHRALCGHVQAARECTSPWLQWYAADAPACMHAVPQVRACHKELLSTVSKVCFMELPQQQAEQQGQRPLGNRARCSAMIKHMMHHTLQFCYLQQRGSGRAELNMGEQQVGGAGAGEG